MATYVILSTLSPDSMQHAREIREVTSTLVREIKAECPDVRWNGTYAVMGQFHVVDILEADSRAEADKVASIIQRVGRASTEVMPAMPWREFLASLGADEARSRTGVRWAWGHSGGF
jgi:uncharacterized protein with GYD domain